MTYSILFSSKYLQTGLEVAALMAILLAFLVPRWRAGWFRGWELRLKNLGRSRWRAVAVSAVLPLAIRLALLPVFSFPTPFVHDEFSYLLMSDTFARGRIVNPPPPEWKHFETEYTLVQPTYSSQYQPAQGLVLAAGQVLTGNPWWGVWISIGLMCGALCWGLSYLLPLPWALCGALGAGLQFGIFGFWMNSYFGGAVAAAAGALVVGSLARMRDKPVSSGIICGTGLIVLFASRPLEGAIWTVIAFIWIFVKYRRESLKIVAAGLLVGTAGGAALGYYDYRVTGDVFQPPYAEGRDLYGTPQSFWWQPAVTVDHFDNPQLQANYLNQLEFWERRYSVRAMWDSTWRRLRDFWRFFIGPFFTPALLFVLLLRRDRRLWPWLLVSIPFILDHATFHAWYPQHSAPATILIVIILLQCWRHLRVWQRQRGWGLALSRYLTAAFGLTFVLIGIGRAAEDHLPEKITRIWGPLKPAEKGRDRLLAKLHEMGGRYLVFVYYPPKHPYIDEWVFNTAEIPGAPVVFARMVNPASDQRLVRAMPGYEVLRVNAETGEVTGPEKRVAQDSGSKAGSKSSAP
ncbi:MAG TPA: hypothetical protein VHC72_09750 [Bryobacteraceae bacterium]|nr:hypothetical protein [Bryobacteraceae bacterium]